MSLSGALLTAISALSGVVFGRAKPDIWYVSQLELPKLPELRADRSASQKAEGPSPVSLPRATNPAPLEMMPLLERKPTPHVLRPEKAAQVFIKYMQDGKAAGVYTKEEIDEAWLMCAEALNLDPLPCQTIRNELRNNGLFIGRKRLALEYAEARIRSGLDRATLYRIPARGRAAGGQAYRSPTNPAQRRSPSGQRPASDENANDLRVAA